MPAMEDRGKNYQGKLGATGIHKRRERSLEGEIDDRKENGTSWLEPRKQQLSEEQITSADGGGKKRDQKGKKVPFGLSTVPLLVKLGRKGRCANSGGSNAKATKRLLYAKGEKTTQRSI